MTKQNNRGKRKTKPRDTVLYRGPMTRSKRAQLSDTKSYILTDEEEFPLLKQLGLYAADIEGDGNCLFRALSDQYYGDGGARHREIRSAVCQYMKEHRQEFEPFLDETETFDQRMERMEEDAVYGDNTEVVAFAQRFNVNVHIYQASHKYVIQCNEMGAGNGAPDRNRAVRECHVAYHTWEHYSSVRKLDGPRSGIPNLHSAEIQATSEDSGITTSNLSSDSKSNIPRWKYNVIVNSIPQTASEEQIIETLMRHNGDINGTIEEFIEQDEAGVENSNNDDDDDDDDDENEAEEGKQSAKQLKQEEDDKDYTEKAKAKTKGKRLTAREKKEQQKRQAIERKRNKLNAASSNISNGTEKPICTVKI